MPGKRREIGEHVSAHRKRPARAAVGLAALGVVAVGTVAFVFLTGGRPAHHPRPLSTTLASQQLAGLAVPGPDNSTRQRLLAPSGGALSFAASGGRDIVLPNERWQADKMTDGSYVLVYVPKGTCLDAAGSAGTAQSQRSGASAPPAELSLRTCNLRLAQRWTHPYLGKDPAGRDYWQLRSNAVGLCVSAAGAQWRTGTPARLEPCSASFEWQQLVEFWSAY